MFSPSNMLQKYLNAQPRVMYDIVGALMGYINADPSFKTNDFENAIQYVLEHGVSESELYEAFDSDYRFEEDPAKWDEDYYSYSQVYLKKNFCEKRISHVKAVAKKLYPSVISTQSERTAPVGNLQTSGVGTVPKKAQSQQQHVNSQKPMPIIVKVLIAVVIVVLLALLISIIKH